MKQQDAAPQMSETFVIAKTDDGFRVCSPLSPAKQYVVTGIPDDPQCTCPDFTHPDRPPEWQCKHIQAVLNELNGATQPKVNVVPLASGNRGSDAPPTRTERKAPGGRNGNGAVMLLKRSVSPDRRIDSLSVEFSCPVGKVTAEELKQSAAGILALQGEIAAGFLKTNGNGKALASRNGETNAVPGQLLAVASMNGKWGRRLFLNVLVNGQVLKFFGNEKQLAEAVTAAGFASVADHLVDGYTLNLPCRVVTRPSQDGKYLNIERVLPAQSAVQK
jgi:hypothetical protein